MYTNGLFAPMFCGHTIEKDCIYYRNDDGGSWCKRGCNMNCGVCRYYERA